MTDSLNKKKTAIKTQKVGTGYSISAPLDGTTTETTMELATPVEKVTIMTTGTLTATVTATIASASFAVGSATGTPSTITLTHLASGFKVVRTAGEGQIIILAK